jgi:K+ transporter
MQNSNLMNFIKKIGWSNLLMLALCFVIIIIAEYLFLSGNKLHGIFIGLWAPTLLGVLIYLKLIEHERR